MVVLLLAFTSVGVAQAIHIFSEPGYAVYVDGDFKGYTPSLKDKMILRDVPAGTHEVRVEFDEEFSKTYTVDVEGFVAELSVDISGPGLFPRSDGYYIGAYKTVSEGLIFKRTVSRNIILYTGIDNPETERAVEFAWTVVNTPAGQKKTREISRLYREWLVNHDRHRREERIEEHIYSGVLAFRKGRVSLELKPVIRKGYNEFLNSPVYETLFFLWIGSLHKDSFTVVLREPSDEPEMDLEREQFYMLGMRDSTEVRFEFVPMRSR